MEPGKNTVPLSAVRTGHPSILEANGTTYA